MNDLEKLDVFQHIKEARGIINKMRCPFCGDKATLFGAKKLQKTTVFASLECDHIVLDCRKCKSLYEIREPDPMPE